MERHLHPPPILYLYRKGTHMGEIHHYEEWAAATKHTPYVRDLYKHVTNPPINDPNFKLNDERVKHTMLVYVSQDVVEKIAAIGWNRSKSAKQTWLALHKYFYRSFLHDSWRRPEWFKLIVHEIWSQGLSGVVILDSSSEEDSQRVNDIITRGTNEWAMDKLRRSYWWNSETHAKETYDNLKDIASRLVPLALMFPGY